MRTWGAVLLAVVLLATTSCASSDGGTDAATGSGDETPSPTASSSDVEVETSPAGCELPPMRLTGEVTVRLLYAKADDTTVPGVSFTLMTATPGGDEVALEVTRTAEGCTGTAHVTLTPDQPLPVLGMRVVSSAPRGVDPVPNRASVVLTVRGGAS